MRLIESPTKKQRLQKSVCLSSSVLDHCSFVKKAHPDEAVLTIVHLLLDVSYLERSLASGAGVVRRDNQEMIDGHFVDLSRILDQREMSVRYPYFEVTK